MSDGDRGATRASGVPGSVPRALGRLPGGAGDLAEETASRLRSTRFIGLVAEVAFFAGAGLVPLAVASVVLISELDGLLGGGVAGRIEDTLRQAIQLHLARDAATSATSDVARLLDGNPTFLLYPLALTIFFSSRAFTGSMRGLARMYGREERRPVWRDALATVGFTVGASFLASLALLGALLDPVRTVGVATVASWARWLVIPALLLLWLTTLYHYAHGPGTRWRDELVGGVVGSTGIVLAAAGYGAYLRVGPTLGLGGFLGPVMGAVLATFTVLLLLAASILIGGAVNAVRMGSPPPD